ncbi:MAG: carbohydrate-binding domain-containing protein [Lachnospiraceae bacterium]|nr:carbohydrate-binding domain-containing protein [Lachnospiraceae bacterium]
MNKITLRIMSAAAAAVLALSLTACSSGGSVSTVSRTGTDSALSEDSTAEVRETQASEVSPAEDESAVSAFSSDTVSQESSLIPDASSNSYDDSVENVLSANVTSSGAIDASDLFTERDLTQTADLSEAVYYTLSDGQDITITEEGVYVLKGSASEVTVTVDAASEDKVQIVLDGVSVTNTDAPCIYVKNADKVFITTASSENTLEVSGTFSADGETSTDAVIFSKDDLVLNGTGSLNIRSTDNGITSKDDIKVTGGSYSISCVSDAFEANDMIAVADGNISVSTEGDAFKAENDEDDTQGMIYICGGTIDIDAGDDGMHAACILQIDGGSITVSAGEGLEATWVQINGGEISLSASDDGINAAAKSSAYTPTLEVNGGYVSVSMGAGDTDALDVNGYLYINGGTLDITAQSPFDYDLGAEYNGGTIIVNGTETDTITNQFGGMGGMPGGQGDDFGGGMQGGFNGGMPGGPNGGFGHF